MRGRRFLVSAGTGVASIDRDTPAVLLASGLCVVAGLFFLDWVGILPFERIVPALVFAVALIVTASVLKGIVTNALVRMPKARERLVVFPVHGSGEIRAFVEQWSRQDRPDVPHVVDYLIHQAVTARASDIHLVPYERFVTLRYRVDGILQDVAELPTSLRRPVTNRLKVLSNLVTFVHDRPQDGRFEVVVGGHRMDVRIAVMPTLHGERVVLRLLHRNAPGLGMAGLGLTEDQHAVLQRLIQRPEGMIALTGPTGSGKTTTIYGALNEILRASARARSIYTLEDPIEYDLLSINQTSIEERFTYAQGLKSMLRQDPDVIMVGEVRDLETARIALQAGMTGHLILTTVHARSAAGVFERLIEMGGDRHSVASAVTAVVGQRLLRLLCPHCKRRKAPTAPQEARLARGLGGSPFYGPVGCPACQGKGYRGRTGLFEIIEVDESLSRLIVERASPDELLREAVGLGIKTLTALGIQMATRGETSLEEVMRVAPAQ